MNVKIADILDKRRVVVQLEGNEFIAEWDGDKPEINESYAVEMDIDDELIWKTNICFSSENDNAIIQKDKEIKIVAKLDYNSEANLATLKVEQEISNEWVEINCDSIRLSNINL